MPALRIVVSGKVQGVGYRYFVSQEAAHHGINGRVWNRRDGCVELVATHPDLGVLTTLVQALWHGPGDVDSVDAVQITDPLVSDFMILRREP
jgi:acylphosphatase